MPSAAHHTESHLRPLLQSPLSADHLQHKGSRSRLRQLLTGQVWEWYRPVSTLLTADLRQRHRIGDMPSLPRCAEGAHRANLLHVRLFVACGFRDAKPGSNNVSVMVAHSVSECQSTERDTIRCVSHEHRFLDAHGVVAAVAIHEPLSLSQRDPVIQHNARNGVHKANRHYKQAHVIGVSLAGVAHTSHPVPFSTDPVVVRHASDISQLREPIHVPFSNQKCHLARPTGR